MTSFVVCVGAKIEARHSAGPLLGWWVCTAVKPDPMDAGVWEWRDAPGYEKCRSCGRCGTPCPDHGLPLRWTEEWNEATQSYDESYVCDAY
jgi:ferredoxin